MFQVPSLPIGKAYAVLRLKDEPRGKTGHMRVILDYLMPAHIEALPALAAAVSDALSADEALAFSANLCLEELIVNSIRYGLDAVPRHDFHVVIQKSDDMLEIILEDDAPHFDPFAQEAAPRLDLGIEERPVGGLGIHIVRSLMDEVKAEYPDHGNRILLRKAIGPSMR